MGDSLLAAPLGGSGAWLNVKRSVCAHTRGAEKQLVCSALIRPGEWGGDGARSAVRPGVAAVQVWQGCRIWGPESWQRNPAMPEMTDQDLVASPDPLGGAKFRTQTLGFMVSTND